MKVRDFSKIYFALLFLHLVVIYKPESEILYLISKPLLLFSLLAYFAHKTVNFTISGKSWISMALLLSLAGDVLLLWDSEPFFLAGMGAFFLAHLFYLTFYLNQKINYNSLYLTVGLVVMGISFYVLYRYIQMPGKLQPYLYGYAVMLGLHLLAATKMLTTKAYGRLPVLGVLLFIISDMLLAFDKFNIGGDKYWHLAVMLTYGLAQYLITIGLISYIEERGVSIERPSG